jgi:predicted acylesterase/phospholipase RssA
MNLVLSGGGMKGHVYISVIKILEEKNITKDIKNFAGVSIGSLFCLLILLEYKYNEINDLFINTNINKIFEVNILNFFENYSLFSSNIMKKIIEIILNKKLKKKNISFIELYNLTNKSLNIVSINISTGKEIIFNKENTPNLDVATCIVASCSIPGLFPPLKIKDEYYIDGFIINNYPIDIFKNDLENTIGISITKGIYYKKYNIQNYIHNLFTLLTKNKESLNQILSKKLKKDIYLETNIFQLEIDLTKEKKIQEMNKSYNILKKAFD